MSDPSVSPASSPATHRPSMELLSRALVERIVAEALDVLGKVGVYVENSEALAVLGDGGARIDRAAQRAFLPEDLVWRAVRSAPSQFTVYSREGQPALDLRPWNVHFDPGSAAIKVLDSATGQARPAATQDLVRFARLTDALPYLDAQSTALVPSDVPQSMGDRYRLGIILLNSSKPVVTGTFAVESFAVMKEMLAAVAGGEQRVRQAPMAIFDACPSPPLKWSTLTSQSLLDCARSGIPAELISMPLLGATAPVTLAGALVQHTAENLSGVAIHQLAGPGSPIVYGGSPAAFDMRHGTTAMGAMETAMLICGYTQIGRFLGLPTHGYLGQSDAKRIDAQAGLESGIGMLMAALAGVNVVSGAGMLEFESCQSFEKLVIDNEICGMVKRLLQGAAARGERLAEDLFGDLAAGDHFLVAPATLRWLREEVRFPGPAIDRQGRETWQQAGGKDAVARAGEQVEDLLRRHQPKPLGEEPRRRLLEIMASDARRHGLDRLPPL